MVVYLSGSASAHEGFRKIHAAQKIGGFFGRVRPGILKTSSINQIQKKICGKPEVRSFRGMQIALTRLQSAES
jgi:hypothetical protein